MLMSVPYAGAMLSGAGALKAFDSRTPNTTNSGQVGGLLQSATYIAGLSGGSWLLGSVVLNNFTTIQALQDDDTLWDLSNSILAPDGALHIVDTAEYYNDLNDEVNEKSDANFEISITDYWGRALSRVFLNWTDAGAAVTFSSIADSDNFQNAQHPFPIVVADGRDPGEVLVSGNTTVFEFNPFEFGSFDPDLYAFTQLEYLGSNVTKGVPNSNDTCVRGFDNGGFLMGTSSTLFNQALLGLSSSGTEGILHNFVTEALSGLAASDADIANYNPNPFYGIRNGSFTSANSHDLHLVDGGEDLQNIPLHPLIQPGRAVDVIFAMDNSADTLTPTGDTTNWPNGTALVATYERSLETISNGTLFPAIPDQNTFINLGLNTRPTWFGCNASNITAGHSSSSHVPPLVVYMPNSPWTSDANTSTMQLAYSKAKRDSLIQNGFYAASQGNGSSSTWAACMACAIIHREIERTNTTFSAQCKQCQTDYCWNGTRDSELKFYDPEVRLEGFSSAGIPSAPVASISLLVAMAFLTFVF